MQHRARAPQDNYPSYNPYVSHPRHMNIRKIFSTVPLCTYYHADLLLYSLYEELIFSMAVFELRT
jgi:hypothetical protein